MNELEEYIQNQLKLGRTKIQLNQILLEHGYDQATIDYAFSEIEAVNNPHSTQQSQTAQTSQLANLDSYVKTYLAQGYSSQQLFDYLLSQGYNQKDLEKTFDRISPNTIQVTHHHNVNNSTFLKFGGLLIVLAMIFVGGYFMFLSPGEELRLLDLSAESQIYTYEAGSPLSFETELLNQGEASRVDIYFTYTIYTDSGNRVLRKQETKAFETTMRDVVTLQLPDDLVGGRYTLEVVANYGQQEAIASFDFFIGDNPSANSNADSYSDTDSTPTTPPLREPDSTHELLPKPKLPKDSKGLSDDELMLKALDSTDIQEGTGICSGITENYLKDECFLLLAQQHTNYQLCNYINSVSRKEDCLIDFVLIGNVNLCSEITLPENQVLCAQFTDLNYIVLYGQNGDIESLMNHLGVTPLPPQNNTADNLDDLDIGDFVT